jgi:hypothetical protein
MRLESARNRIIGCINQPNPASRVVNLRATPEHLSERFGDRIRRDLRVASREHQRSPETISLLPIHGFDGALCVVSHLRLHVVILHVTHQGRERLQILNDRR